MSQAAPTAVQTLTIDGRSVPFVPGQTVLQAAEAAGIDIPNLCAYPTLKPFGRCRLCLVQIEGLRGYPSACTTPTAPGMVVVTESPELTELRRGALELVLTEHPTGCLLCGHQSECLEHHGCHARRSGTVTGCRFCPMDQQCELQDMVNRLGVHDTNLRVRYRGLPVDRRDPFFDRDYNLCILCARCVRVCDERRGARAVALTWRGPQALVGTAYNMPLTETECQFCGECVDACPTGALAERVNKWVGVPESATRTTCPFCGLGCPLELRALEGQVVGARPADHAQLCAAGRFAPVEVALANTRLLEPQIRRHGRLNPVPWDEALTAAAVGLTGELGIFASRDLLQEDLAALQRLAEVYGPAHVATDAVPAPTTIASLAAVEASRRLVVVGADLRYHRTPALLAVQRAVASGARLTVIATEPSDLDRLAERLLLVEPGGEADACRELADEAEAETVVIVAETVAGEAVAELVEALGAGLLTLPVGANSRGALELGLSPEGLGDWWSGARPLDTLVSFGRPPGASRPPVGFWVHCGHLADEVVEQADVVLPLTVFTEQNGTVVDVFGQRREVRAAVAPAGECRTAATIAGELAARVRTSLAPPRPAPEPDGTGAPSRSTGRTAGEVILLRRASAWTYLGQPLTAQVPGLIPLAADGLVRLNPSDAVRFGVREGDTVELAGATGAIEAAVRLDTRVRPGAAALSVPAALEPVPDGAPLAAALGDNPSRVTIRTIRS